MGELTKELRTLFNAVDPLGLYGHGREHVYDRAIAQLEARLGGRESPEHVDQLLRIVFQDLYGREGEQAILAQEIADLLHSLGV